MTIGNNGSLVNLAFTSLNDTPNTYLNKARNLVKVNSSETQLEFVPDVDNIVLVKSQDDLPIPVGGIITLEAKSYLLDGLITITNTIKPPPNAVSSFQGINGLQGGLNYTGSGTLFENSALGAAFFFCLQMSIICSAGKVMDITGDIEGFMFFDTVAFIGAINDFGNVTTSACTMHLCNIRNWKTGLTIDGSSGFTFGRVFAAGGQNNAGALINIKNNNGPIQIGSNFFKSAGSNESFIDIDSSSTTTGGNAYGNSIDLTLGGDVFKSGSKDQTDTSWKFRANANITDSKIKGELIFNGNAVDTDIPAQNSWVIINSIIWTSDSLERLTTTNSGIITYIGNEASGLNADANINLEPDLSTHDLSSMFICIDSVNNTVTFDNTTNIIIETSTSRADDDIIIFLDSSGTLPAELRKDVVYFIVNANVDDFQVSYTQGGSAIAFSDDGTPINSYSIATFHGSSPGNSIAANNPRDIVPQALIDVVFGSKIAIAVSNRSASADILVSNAYIRIKD